MMQHNICQKLLVSITCETSLSKVPSAKLSKLFFNAQVQKDKSTRADGWSDFAIHHSLSASI